MRAPRARRSLAGPRNEEAGHGLALDDVLHCNLLDGVGGNRADAIRPFFHVIDRKPDGECLPVGGSELVLIVALIGGYRDKLRLRALEIGGARRGDDEAL